MKIYDFTDAHGDRLLISNVCDGDKMLDVTTLTSGGRDTAIEMSKKEVAKFIGKFAKALLKLA